MIQMRLWTLLVIVSAGLIAVGEQSSPAPQFTDVYTAGENGYHTYGDPWSEQRFSSQETREAHQVRRRAKELGIVPGG